MSDIGRESLLRPAVSQLPVHAYHDQAVFEAEMRSLFAPRHAPGEKPPVPLEISPAPGDLEACVGRYRLGPAEFTVTQEDSKLMVQLTGQPKIQVFASARDEFFYKVVNAQLSFVREADGKVVALILHQNGHDQRAVKE